MSFASLTLKAYKTEFHFSKLDAMIFTIGDFFNIIFRAVVAPIEAVFKKKSTFLSPINVFIDFIDDITSKKEKTQCHQ